MQLKHYLLTSWLALGLAIIAIDSFAQDGAIIERLNSFSDFQLETDTLFKGKTIDPSGYDYQIRYFERRNFYGKKLRYGTIVIKGDSMINYYNTQPSIVGDLFSATPTIVDSLSSGVTRTKVNNSDIKCLKRLGESPGFYSQHLAKGGHNVYPRSWVRCFVISNTAEQFFGIIEYGSNEIDYKKIAPDASEAVKHVIKLVF